MVYRNLIVKKNYFRIQHGYMQVQLELIKYVLDMPTSLYISFFKWQFVPMFHYLLLCALRISEAVDLLNSTKFLLDDKSNVLGKYSFKSWFFCRADSYT